MEKIVIYEYDKKYRIYIEEQLEKNKYAFMVIPVHDKIAISMDDFPDDTKGIIIDISLFFRDEEKALIYAQLIEKLIDALNAKSPIYLIIDKRYSQYLKDVLYYKIKKIVNLSEKFAIDLPVSRDIVEIEEKEFKDIIDAIQNNLVGQEKFKKRLEEELRKYRVFNRLGYQPIFSVLICGKSGIGKTEVARILRRELSPSEPFIKINFGNYSDQNALSSLIGSPRGYVGSNKGELSDKLENSNSKLILIDEFEKSNKQVQNFFLQLLEDGFFTDSLGRDYDLNRYIIIFTANLSKDKIAEKISPELLSRFNFKYSFSEMSAIEKKEYVDKRVEKIVYDISQKLHIDINDEQIIEIKNIDITRYSNMRDVNSEVMRRVSEIIYPQLYDLEEE